MTAPAPILTTAHDAALEAMTCTELCGVIRTLYAMQDAERAGCDGFAASLRTELARALEQAAQRANDKAQPDAQLFAKSYECT